MNEIERLKQYINKANFSSESDRYSALECVAKLEHKLSLKITTGNAVDDAQEMAWVMLDEMVLRDS